LSRSASADCPAAAHAGFAEPTSIAESSAREQRATVRRVERQPESRDARDGGVRPGVLPDGELADQW